ncbi:histidine kinase N-terminal 7TM domain-containing protein [Salarchaeum japonicum]|uniref:histidine kinase n=1 Tax=Salarchaeum japonicum TaxID=555573 RepID=A0AAV3SZF3_9EURY|nr:histidine kinase N-terminal 7TM domain-containing protein [Salarchaeum japonicum]
MDALNSIQRGMQVTPEVWVSLVSGAAALLVAGYAWRSRTAPGARALTAFLVASAVWAAGNAAQVAATTLPQKLLAVDAQYVGIAFAPVAWLVFAAQYADRDSWLTPRTLALLCLLPAATLALAWTNGLHGLVRTDAALETTGGVVTLTREFGPWFWVAWAYFGVTNTLGTLFLLGSLVGSPPAFRGQVVAVLVGVSVPAVAQVAYFAGASPFEPEAFVGVTAVAFGYALSRHALLDVVPVARDTLVEELDDGVLVVNAANRVVDANGAAERLLDATDVVGESVDDVLSARVRGADDETPVSVTDADGRERWVTVTESALDDGGTLVRIRDVTELERKRRELARENDRLNRVADTISHDVRSPLTVAAGSLALARETGSVEDFDRAERALDRVERVVDSTVRAARTDLGVPDRERVDIESVARDAWETSETGDAALAVESTGTVLADRSQVRSLLENLFRNAVAHGGAETVRVQATDAGFVVADDGTGIAADERERVFDTGYTTSDAGTGLGLSIVQAIADAHDWTVTLDGADEGGARFAFETSVETGNRTAAKSRGS